MCVIVYEEKGLSPTLKGEDHMIRFIRKGPKEVIVIGRCMIAVWGDDVGGCG